MMKMIRVMCELSMLVECWLQLEMSGCELLIEDLVGDLGMKLEQLPPGSPAEGIKARLWPI